MPGQRNHYREVARAFPGDFPPRIRPSGGRSADHAETLTPASR